MWLLMALVSFLLPAWSYSQDSGTVVNSTKNRTSQETKVLQLLAQSRMLLTIDTDSAYQLALSARRNLGEINNQLLQYDLYRLIGDLEKEKGAVKKAIIADLNSLKIAEQIDDKRLIADANFYLGKSYKRAELYEKAKKHLLNAELYYSHLKALPELAKTRNILGDLSVDLGIIHANIHLLKRAERYYLLVLDYYKKSQKKEFVGNLNIALANLYLRYYSLSKNRSAIDKSIAYSESALLLLGGDSLGVSAGLSITNIGEAYGLIGEYKLEQSYYFKAKKMFDKAGNKSLLAGQLVLIIRSLRITNDFDDAFKYLKELYVLSKQGAVFDGMCTYYLELSETQQKMGNYKDAYESRKRYEKEYALFTNQEKEREILRLQVENDLIQKDKQIQILNRNKLLQNNNISNQSKIRNLLVVGVLLAFILTGLLFFRFREKNRVNKLIVEKNILLQKLSIVASETMNGVFITDQYGVPEWMNEGYQRMFGWDSIDDFMEHTGNQFLALSSLTIEELKGYQQTAISERKSITYQSKNLTKTGVRLDIQSSMTPVFNEYDELSYWVLVETDITELSIAKEMAEREQKISEHALEIQELFIANVSHEIRTPMNGIMGLSRQMNHLAFTSEQKEIAETILQSSKNLLHVVNDLLDLSKIRAGKMSFEKKPFRLDELLTHLAKSFLYRVEEKQLKLITSIDPSVPKMLIGDAIRVNQIMMNLVGNAIKFTENGKITLHIEVEEFKHNQVFIRYSVRDTGIGIPEEKLAFIFENFAQIEDHHTRSAGGTGLGLGISKTLVECLGGTMEVASELGIGSTFSFTLPFEIGLSEDTIRHSENHSNDLTDISVLLVEDNKINQLVAVFELEKWKAKVMVANNAEEAFNHLRKHSFDVVLMDISMPKMDGVEATHLIRTTFPDTVNTIPIIAMTASAMLGDYKKYLVAGMNDYISKPYDPEMLLAMLLKWTSVKKRQETPVLSRKKKELSSTIVDLSLLKERSNGDVNYLIEMYVAFVDNMPLYLAELITAFNEGRMDDVRNEAHKMLSPSRLFGLTDIAANLEELETIGQKNEQELTRLIERISADYSLVFRFVKIELAKLRKKSH